MKKNVFLFTLCLSSYLLVNQSCSSSKATTVSAPVSTEAVESYNGPITKVDRFVSIESVADLSAGMTYAEVVAKLGSKPYNVFSAQANGHRAVQYKYRLLNMEVPTDNINDNGIEKGKNKYNYMPGYQDLFLIFDGTDKLEYLSTTEGDKTEKLLRDNNLLYVIKKDKAKFSSDTTSAYRLTNADAFYPLFPCTTCSPIPQKQDVIKKDEISESKINTPSPSSTIPKKVKLSSIVQDFPYSN